MPKNIVRTILVLLAIVLGTCVHVQAQSSPNYRKMNNKQKKERTQELLQMPVDMDSLLEMDEDEIRALKKEYQYFRAYYKRKSNTLLYTGIGLTVAGIAGGIVGGAKKSLPITLGGVAVGAGGIFVIVRSAIYGGYVDGLERKSHDIIIASNFEPIKLDLASAKLSAGCSISTNMMNQAVAIGPSITLNF